MNSISGGHHRPVRPSRNVERFPFSGKCAVILSLVAASLAVLTSGGDAAPQQPARATWYKGIVHAHANWGAPQLPTRSEEHTSELQSRGLTSYAVFCLKKNMSFYARPRCACKFVITATSKEFSSF